MTTNQQDTPNSSRAPARVPYGKKASQWILALKTCLVDAGITSKARHALESFAAEELRRGKRLDWSRNQLAHEGGCDRRTVDRNISKLLTAGLIEIVEVGSHSQRKASLYRLTRLVPTFQVQVAGSPQRSESPSPLELRSKKTSKTTHPNIQNTQQGLVKVVDVIPSPWEGSRDEILQLLATLGQVGPKGFRDAEANSPFDGQEALLVARAAVEQAPAKAHRGPVGWALAALKNETFGRSLLVPKVKAEPDPSPWGEDVGTVEAELKDIPADPGGIASAKKQSWCDAPTALRVIQGCKVYWKAGKHAENPGGWVVAALKGRALGEAMLGLVQERDVDLGCALQTYRQLDWERRFHWREKPEEVWMGWPALSKSLQTLAAEVRQVLPAPDVEAAVQDLAQDRGFPPFAPISTALEAQGVVLAGLRAGLLTGWDLQTLVGSPPDGRKRAVA